MPPSRDRSHRTFSALLVLLLHAFLLVALTRFLVKPPAAFRQAPETRLLEMIISTARPPKPLPETSPQPADPVRAPAPPTAIAPNEAPAFTLPVPGAPPDLKGFGEALAGCAPENLGNLSPDQRAHCTGGFTRPDDTAVIEPKSHVKDPERRSAEMRAKNGLPRVPCTSIVDAPVSGGTVAVPMVDPICMLNGASNGFRPLNGLSK